MALILTDDYVQLEKIEQQQGGIYLPHAQPEPLCQAKVVAVGPGRFDNFGVERLPMPCKVGDTVLVHAGAGIRSRVGNTECWFVYAERKDIVAVVEEVPCECDKWAGRAQCSFCIEREPRA